MKYLLIILFLSSSSLTIAMVCEFQQIKETIRKSPGISSHLEGGLSSEEIKDFKGAAENYQQAMQSPNILIRAYGTMLLSNVRRKNAV